MQELLRPPLAPADDTRVNQRYLHPFTPRDGTLIVQSGLGTGKITALNASLHATKRVLYLSHLIALTCDAANRIDLDSYDALAPEAIPDSDRLAICLNSLWRLAQGRERNEPFDVIVIDESEQLLRRLTTNVPNKRRIMSVLRYLVRQARTVIALDAHAGRLTRRTLARWRPQHQPITLTNEHESAAGRTLHLHKSADHVLDHATRALAGGEPAYLALNSRAAAERAHAFLQHRHPTARGLLITGGNTQDEDVMTFLADVNAPENQYDFVVASPALATGVSINTRHYRFVGGIFESGINTAMDALQSLSRVRHPSQMHVFVSQARARLPEEPEEIRRKWRESADLDAEYAGCDVTSGFIGINDVDYEHLYIDAKQLETTSGNDLLTAFTLLAQEQGYGIERNQAETSAPRHMQAAKRLADQGYREAILAAPDLTQARADTLERKQRRTQAETHQIERHHLKTFYAANETELPDLIDLDERGRYRERIQALELALTDMAALLERQRERIKREGALSPDTRRIFLERELYRRTLAAVGLPPDTLLRPGAPPEPPRYDAKRLAGYARWVQEHYADLSAATPLPSERTLRERPIRFVGSLLKCLGLKQQREGRNAHGRYRVDKESLEHLLGVTRRRQAARRQVEQGSARPERTVSAHPTEPRPGLLQGGGWRA